MQIVEPGVGAAADADGRIAKTYAVDVRESEPGKKDTRGKDIVHGRAERTTFVTTSDGKIDAVIKRLSMDHATR